MIGSRKRIEVSWVKGTNQKWLSEIERGVVKVVDLVGVVVEGRRVWWRWVSWRFEKVVLKGVGG